MRKVFFFLSLLLFCAFSSFGQNKISGPIIQTAVAFDVSIPLRDMKPVKKPFWAKWKRENEMEVPNKFRPVPPGFTPDGALQTAYNNSSKATTTMPIVNFDGTTNASNTGGRVTPPDPAGDVGPNHYVQLANCMLQIFNKTGASLYGPVATSTLWNGFSGNWDGHNNGDGIVVYDENADRWIISQFAYDCPGTPYTEYEMVAVSTTGDPTGSYYRYAFQFDYMPDYPKFGVWQDGYYLSVNRFNTNIGSTPFIGVGACVLERSKMLTGDPTARMVYFKTETLGGSGSGAGSSCWAMLPSDCDGTFPAAGTPNYFAYIDGSSELRLWALHTDWTTTTNSTFTYVTALPVAAYTELGSVPEQGSLALDGLGDRLMFRNQYRKFGSYETFVTCHSVNTGSGVAGIRWYEYRKTGSTFSLYQQSTYAPGDGKSRWMGSIAMNSSGDIGLAYSVSSSTMHPSIYFTGRKAADPLNQMSIAEGIIQTGTVSMTTISRWGDYSAINIDPTDNITFWTTQEYVGTYGGWCPWATKIASFKFTNQPTVATQDATAITMTAATLNGTVNPNGLATTYHFEWGTTVSYGNNTTTTSAGSGTATLPESANITGLTAGTTYHFRIVAVNSDGTSNGTDFTFVPGAAAVTTTAASAITTTTATAGGNVTTDGGSSVTARGTCWGTAANPTIAGSHTTDGTGTGVFTSSLTGLTANTTYHNRAYATNANGTVYGSDLTFTTSCGVINTLPFTEGFEALTTTPACWSEENSNPAWQYITGNGNTHPATAHTGVRNACLKDATVADNKNKLITPVLDLSAYSNIVLTFWHTQAVWTGDQDQLAIYYKASSGGAWVLLQTYTNSITAWTQETINLPNTGSYYQVGFEGNAKYGYGVCLDDVSITGTTGGPFLSVTPANQNVPATPAGSTPFTVTSNSSWTVVSSQTWCTVTPSGTGNGTITANYTINTSVNSRVANVTTTVTGISPVVVTVTQAGATPTLTVTPANQNVPATPAGSTSFAVTSNTSWNVVSDQTWCTVTPSGTGNGTITANYTENTLPSVRIATITVTVFGIPSVDVTVTQAGTAPSLIISPSNQDVTPPAGTTNFTVTTTASTWTAVSDMTWCTVTPSGSGNGTIVANYTENTSTSTRIATITVSASGLPSQTSTVTQFGAAATLSVSPPNQNVTTPAGLTNFTVTSNSNWIANSDVTWCSVTPSGTGSGTLVATYQANPSTAIRTANITVTVSGITPVEVSVIQDGLVGVADHQNGTIRIIPNPATGLFRIVPGISGKILHIDILDLTGRILLSREYTNDDDYQFDLSSKPQGCYFVKVRLNDEILVRRLVISK